MPRWYRGAVQVARFGVVGSIFMIWVILSDSQEADTPEQDIPVASLDVWLDHKQTKEFTGLDSPIFLVRNGKSSTFLTRSLAADSSLGVARLLLSPDDDVMNISWRAPPRYYYTIDERFTSLPEVSFNPEFSIPRSGLIPTKDTAFSVYFRCTGRKSGVSSVGFVLRIRNGVHGKDLETPSSPLKIHFEKECEKDIPRCKPECQNGGICNDFHQCDCPDGFYGPDCRQALCNPHCYNGGTCISPGVCMCPVEYMGDACQTAYCENDCNQHGHCVGPGRCECHKSWQGKYCDKHLTSPLYSRLVKQTQKSHEYQDKSRTHNNAKYKPNR